MSTTRYATVHTWIRKVRAGRAAQPGAAAKESDQDLMSAPVTRASSRTEHPDGPAAHDATEDSSINSDVRIPLMLHVGAALPLTMTRDPGLACRVHAMEVRMKGCRMEACNLGEGKRTNDKATGQQRDAHQRSSAAHGARCHASVVHCYIQTLQQAR
jgi:hypothetical protein